MYFISVSTGIEISKHCFLYILHIPTLNLNFLKNPTHILCIDHYFTKHTYYNPVMNNIIQVFDIRRICIGKTSIS